MLGFVTITDMAGSADRLLAETAQRLAAQGLRLAGAVQTNTDRGAGRVCDMQLAILGDDGPAVAISQDLGQCAQGCRLDTHALAQAVARAEAVLADGADLVIVNKFGKQEALGGGFRDFIARALAQDVPVLLSVPPEQLPEFRAFAEGMAEELAPETLLDWCRAKVRSPA
jgi:nucleoside-triphosphatase THEP1